MISNARRPSRSLWAVQLVLAMAVALIALTDGAAVFAETPLLPAQLGVEAEFESTVGGDSICTLKLTDLESGKVVAAPRLRFSVEEPGNLTINSPDGTSGWTVDVATDAEQSLVRLTISRVHEGVAKIVHQMSVRRPLSLEEQDRLRGRPKTQSGSGQPTQSGRPGTQK